MKAFPSSQLQYEALVHDEIKELWFDIGVPVGDSTLYIDLSTGGAYSNKHHKKIAKRKEKYIEDTPNTYLLILPRYMDEMWYYVKMEYWKIKRGKHKIEDIKRDKGNASIRVR